MHYIGIDLHKKTISLCVMSKGRKVLCEKVLRCDNEAGIIEFFGRCVLVQREMETSIGLLGSSGC